MISSIYDPLRLVAPYTLKGKKLPQQLCQDEVGWDETAPEKTNKERQIRCKTLNIMKKPNVVNPVGLGR